MQFIIIYKAVINMIDEEFISKRISELRMSKNISARDMSLSIGQSPGYINNIENKKSMPSIQMLLYICEFLKIHPKDFFYEEVSNPNVMNETMDILKNLKSEQLAHILAIAKEMRH